MTTGTQLTTALNGAQSGALTPAQERKQTVERMMEAARPYIMQALPKHLTADRLLRVALTAINTTPALAECSPASLVSAVVSSSQLGLEPNTPLGHAYLVPYYNGKAKRKDAQLIIGYKGLIDLSRRSGNIVSIAARAVYANDEFKVTYGLEENVEHIPCMTGDRGELIAVYAVARLKGGGVALEVMSRREVEAIRDNSEGYKASQKFKFSNPWTTAFDEMARKTAIRRLAKYLPMSIEDRQFAEAVSMEDAPVKPDAALSEIFGDDGTDGGEVVDHETGEVLNADTDYDE